MLKHTCPKASEGLEAPQSYRDTTREKTERAWGLPSPTVASWFWETRPRLKAEQSFPGSTGWEGKRQNSQPAQGRDRQSQQMRGMATSPF